MTAQAGSSFPAQKARILDRMSRDDREEYVLFQVASWLSILSDQAPNTASEFLVAYLEHIGAGAPQLDPFGDLRGDARFWADVAHPAELESYVAAGLRRLERTQLCTATRKRLFVALWDAMSEEDRRKFLQKADPTGAFTRSPA